MARVTVDDALDQESAVLKAFVAEDGSLIDLPTKLRKRLVVLHYVAQAFDVDRDYPEVEVNSVLRGYHPDVAAVRRYLVDEGFLTREKGIYRRQLSES